MGGLGPGRRMSSQLMSGDNEGNMLGDLVVQRSASRVGGLCLPVDTRAPGLPRRFVHGLNQAPPYASPAKVLGRVEVLKVADIMQPGCAAMEDVVGETNETTGLF